MNSFWEILKITVPALLVFLTAWLLFRNMIKNDQRRREFEFKINHSKEMTPVKLQAYERLTLFLERIAPESMLLRLSPHNQTVSEYHQLLLANIRQEFEHNISQQIYISPILWETIRASKEKLITLINESAEGLDLKAPAYELSKQIFIKNSEEEVSAVSIALSELKKEVALYL